MDDSTQRSAVSRVLDDPDLVCAIFANFPDQFALRAAVAVNHLWQAQSLDDQVWRNLYHRRWGATGASEPPLRDVRVGALVEISGLASRPELNGRVAQAVEWFHDSGRWAVQPVDARAFFGADVEETAIAEMATRHQEQAIKVRPSNLSAEWRLRFRRRLFSMEFKKTITRAPQLTSCDEGSGFFTNTYGVPGRQGVVLRACGPMRPVEDELSYFEVAVSGSSVGMTGGRFYDGTHALHIGWRPTSYGYHSDDGSKWRNDAVAGPRSNGLVINGEAYGEAFGGVKGEKMDIAGCGVDHKRRSIFFTKNGKLQGTAFVDVLLQLDLFPTVALHEHGDKVRFNFGAEPFRFDLPAFATSAARWAGVQGGGELPLPSAEELGEQGEEEEEMGDEESEEDPEEY